MPAPGHILGSTFLVAFLACASGPIIEPLQYTTFRTMNSVRFSRYWNGGIWERAAPFVRTIAVSSSQDSSLQNSLYYDSGSERKKPLLIVLHSWSASYRQSFSVPYAEWARENDWVFLAPDYRGRFNKPEALSEIAQQDVLDAMEYALANSNINRKRIYLAGYSGGATMALIMAARYKKKFTAVVAWSPIYNLEEWYHEVQGSRTHYPGNVESICSGVPFYNNRAHDECLNRSPSEYLDPAACRGTYIYIGTGLYDPLVDPENSIFAFNRIAAPDEFIPSTVLDTIASGSDLHLSDQSEVALFASAGHNLLFARDSRMASLRIYNGRHDVIYNAGLHWLSRKSR